MSPDYNNPLLCHPVTVVLPLSYCDDALEFPLCLPHNPLNRGNCSAPP